MITRRTFFLLLFLGVHLGLGATPGAPQNIRVLTVGNSFSQNATHYLADLAKASGDAVFVREADVGGASLALHWSKVEAFEKDPADPLGRYPTHKSLREELSVSHWDFVTFQQASIDSHDVATYRPFAKELSDYIRLYAPDAILLLHETWEYRVDDPRFSTAPAKSAKPGEPKSQDEMYEGLSKAYAAIAQELGVRRLPVGDAFHLANHDPQWGYHAPATSFDPLHAQPGELPDQTHSLNAGWSWKKQPDGASKPVMDGHHANLAGEYLGACVWYEVLFGKNVEENSFTPSGLDPDYARFLRATAHRTVKGA